VMTYNTIWDCGTGIMNKFTNNTNYTVAYNYVDLTTAASVSWDAIALSDCNNGTNGSVSIHHNILISPTPWGVDYWSGNQGMGSNVYNNTFVMGSTGAGSNAFINQLIKSSNALLTFQNNLLANPVGESYHQPVVFMSVGQTVDYNIYPPGATNAGFFMANSVGTNGYGPSYSFSTWKSIVGYDAHGSTGTPTFVNGGIPLGANDPILTSAAGWALVPGSVGDNAGSDGADVGAWGGASPPSRIGTDW